LKAVKRGLTNVVFGVFGQLIIIGLGVIIPRLVLVSYGSEINGLLNSIVQILLYFDLFEAGICTASLQALYGPVERNDRNRIQQVIAATHRYYTKVGFIYSGAVIVFAFVYPLFIKVSLPYWMVFCIVLCSGLSNSLNFLYQGKYKILMQAEGKSYIISNFFTITSVLSSLSKAVLLVMGFNVLAVQFAFFVVNLLQMFMYAVYVKKNYSWVDLKTPSDDSLIKQRSATLVHQIARLVFNNVDILMLTVLTKNLKVVSVYTIYNTIIGMINVLINQLVVAFEFRLGQIYNASMEQYKRLHHLFEVIYIVIIFSVMTTVNVVILPFMRLYTAGVTDINYIDKWYPLLFTLIPLFYYGRSMENSLINFAGHFKQTQWSALTELALNLSLSTIGILLYGVYGALIATIIASLYRTIDMILYVYRHLIDGSPWTSFKRWIAAFVVYFVVTYFVGNNHICNDYFQLIIYAVMCGAISFVAHIIIQCIINIDEMRFIMELVRGRKNYEHNA